MRICLISACLALFLVIPAATAATNACSALDGWNAGRQGQVAQTECDQDAYTEAHRLGSALAELHQQHTDVEKQIIAEPENAGALRRRQRQLDVDIEAIHGVAVLRGWPVDATTPKPEGETP